MSEPITIARAIDIAREDYLTIESLAVALMPTTAEDPSLLLDGGMFAPSHRAMQGASEVWASDNADAWVAYMEEFELLCDNFSSTHEHYFIGWDEGVLWLYSPNYEEA